MNQNKPINTNLWESEQAVEDNLENLALFLLVATNDTIRNALCLSACVCCRLWNNYLTLLRGDKKVGASMIEKERQTCDEEKGLD